jgi:predicted small lipoprotein YifL
MKTSARKPWLLVPVLLFSLAGCGLKGPLYLPDQQPEEVPAGSDAPKPVLEGSKVRSLPPAPQSQKKDRERATTPNAPSQSQPTPVSPPDPDRPATTPPPPGP